MWSLVALDRWSSCTVTIAWKFAWVDSALVVLDEWSPYRAGRLSRFDCRIYLLVRKLLRNLYRALFRA